MAVRGVASAAAGSSAWAGGTVPPWIGLAPLSETPENEVQCPLFLCVDDPRVPKRLGLELLRPGFQEAQVRVHLLAAVLLDGAEHFLRALTPARPHGLIDGGIMQAASIPRGVLLRGPVNEPPTKGGFETLPCGERGSGSQIWPGASFAAGQRLIRRSARGPSVWRNGASNDPSPVILGPS